MGGRGRERRSAACRARTRRSLNPRSRLLSHSCFPLFPFTARGYKALLSDFGLSKVLDGGGTHMSTRTYGTIAFMPPELIRDGRLSSSADVYAFGILMWALYSGVQPYEGLPTATVFYKVAIEGARPEVDPATPPEYASLMTACWAARPADRPSFKQVYATLTPLAVAAREAARAAARVGGGGGGSGGAGSWAGGARQGSGASAGVGSVGGAPAPAAPVAPPPPAEAADPRPPSASPDRPLPPPVRPGPFAALARQMSPFRRSLSRQRSSGGGEE